MGGSGRHVNCILRYLERDETGSNQSLCQFQYRATDRHK